VVEVGTSKPRGGGSGSHNKRYRLCSESGVYAPGPDEEEEIILK